MLSESWRERCPATAAYVDEAIRREDAGHKDMGRPVSDVMAFEMHAERAGHGIAPLDATFKTRADAVFAGLCAAVCAIDDENDMKAKKC